VGGQARYGLNDDKIFPLKEKKQIKILFGVVSGVGYLA
jgi:hypothetical protein